MNDARFKQMVFEEIAAVVSALGKPIDYDELIRRIRSGQAILIDVRPEEEYTAGHVPGAVSVLLERLPDEVEKLPRDMPNFAYCRGRYCVLSHEAVQVWLEHGYPATSLPVGIAEWKAAGARFQST